MTLKHPEYAHGISDAELIKEALEFCNEELDGYEGMEYDDDCEVACQRSNTFIRELVRRLEAETPFCWVRINSDGRPTYWENEVPDSQPLFHRTLPPAQRAEVEEKLTPKSNPAAPARGNDSCP